MGTNYYIKNILSCPECGTPAAADYHIGKSSAGWCFSLHVDPDGINNLEDIKRLWRGRAIKDEYDSTISKKEMVAIITERSWKGSEQLNSEFHKLNHSEPGPNGLLRHQIDGFCIGHGPGTYDYLIGYFS